MTSRFLAYRHFSLLLAFVFLCYSCKVYYKDPVTLDEAVLKKDRAKVYTVSEREFKFKYIIQEDAIYYGLIKSKGEFERIQLNPSEIEKVRLQNKTMSTVCTVLLSVLVVPVLIIIGYGIAGGGDIIGP